jgi:hypothetical protein
MTDHVLNDESTSKMKKIYCSRLYFVSVSLVVGRNSETKLSELSSLEHIPHDAEFDFPIEILHARLYDVLSVGVLVVVVLVVPVVVSPLRQ